MPLRLRQSHCRHLTLAVAYELLRAARSSPVLTLRKSNVWRRLNLDHGLRSLQSRPVYLRDGTPYGTFVLAYREPRKETDWDVALMKFAADAAGLIIQSDLDRRDIVAEPPKADAPSA
jgi:GAF domain-containing protein